jgi:hypothetical protein
MPNTPPLPVRHPMLLVDQHGGAAYAWYPPGTPTDPLHVLPDLIYAELCRLAGVAPSSPWVAFPGLRDARAAALAETLAVRRRVVGKGD